MANLLFEVVFKAVDALSAKVNAITTSFEKLNKGVKATASMRETGENLTRAGLTFGAVGAAGTYAVKSFVDAAMEQQAALAHVQTAMYDGAKTQEHLNEVRETSDRLALQGVISTKQLSDGYYIARSNMLGHEDALKAIKAAQDLVTGTTKNATDAQAAMEQTTRTLTELHNNFGGSMQFAADQLAKLQTKYAFRDITEITEALGYVQPTAKNTGVALTQMNAALATLSANGIHAGQAGTTLNQVISKIATGGSKGLLIPFIRKTAQGGLDLQKSIEAISAALSKMDQVQRTAFLKEAGFGVRELRGAEVLVSHLGEMADVQIDLQNAAGTAAEAAATRLHSTDEQIERFRNSMDVLREALGVTLLPIITIIAQALSNIIARMVDFGEAHPIAGQFVKVFAAMSIGLLTFGGILTGVGIGLKGLSYALPLIRALKAAITAVTFNPWLIALAAIAVAIYEVYKHWDSIKPVVEAATAALGRFALAAESGTRSGLSALGSFVLQIEDAIRTFVYELIPEAFNWGVRLIDNFGKGILSAADKVGAAVKRVASTVMSYMPWHSPADVGPMSQLPRIHIAESIAERIRPEPINLAMARLLPALNILGGVTLPASGAGSTAPSQSATRGASHITFNLHYSPTISGAAPGNLSTQNHADDMFRILKEKIYREQRLMFDHE